MMRPITELRKPSTMRLTYLVLASAAALLQGCANNAIRTGCDNPRVSNFGSPTSYVVMLPYRYGGKDAAREDSAQQINRITQLQALQGSLDMPTTQITFVEGDAAKDTRCRIEYAYDRVIENRSSLLWRRPYHSAIFLWGEIYDRDDGVIVQSHMRIFWNGSADRELEVRVPVPNSSQSLLFTGDMPSDTISFPPQTFSASQMAQLSDIAKASLQVREEPRLDAKPTPLPRRFAVMSWKRPWLELVGRDLRKAWVLVDDDGLRNNNTALPETTFMHAMASYLNFRVDSQDSSRRQAINALDKYRSAIATSNSPLRRESLALSKVMEGTMAMTSNAADPSHAVLADASRELPTNGNVLNLVAMTAIPACCNNVDSPARITQIQTMLEQASMLEPGDDKIGRNLINWYRLLGTLPADTALPFPRAELTTRLQQATQALADWTAVRGR
jgi:hypothetical protein